MDVTWLKSFELPSREREEIFLSHFLTDIRLTCYTTFYPFNIFRQRTLPRFELGEITILAGGNGCGKSTALNVLAGMIGIGRDTAGNSSSFFRDYVRLCDCDWARGRSQAPEGSRLMTSDGVFDYMLDLRAINEGVDLRRDTLLEDYDKIRRTRVQMRSMEDYEALKQFNEANRKSKSRFVAARAENIRERSNGESALRYFTDSIKENALYLLDEPENSLSPRNQLELRQFIEDSARFYGCQFVIATHSPFLLSLRDAVIYDLDAEPVCTRRWTELPNVRAYYDFFMENRGKFE